MRIFLLILFCVPVCMLSAQTEGLSEQYARVLRNNKDGKTLREISFSLLNKGDYDQAIHYAKQLEVLGDIDNNDNYRMYGAICLGQALLINGQSDQAKHYMDRSLELALKLQSDTALCSVYNGLGLYSLNVEQNYYRATSMFFKGIEAAKRCSYKRLYSILLSNLSGVYFLRSDPTGLQYAQEGLEMGLALNDAYMIYVCATSLAYSHYLLCEYDKALKYIQQAETTMANHQFLNEAHVYNIYGNIYHAIGNDALAISHLDKALSYQASSQSTSLAYTYLSYAQIRLAQEQYAQAIILAQKGIDASTSVHRPALYQLISSAYELSGQHKQALAYHKLLRAESDSLFNMDKERSLHELRIQYDLERHENELQQSEIRNMKRERSILLMFIGIILFSSGFVVLYFLYHKKNKLYLQIVRQSQEALKKQKQLEHKIQQLQDSRQEEKYTVSSLSDEKGLLLFNQLESLLRDQGIYREKNLTKDKLSKLLNTNRTYLSQVINENTGLSFTHYVNTFRINEALNILSDTKNNIPIKALASDLGYSSINTFYTAFQAAVGLTPSLYRTKLIELQKKPAVQAND